jgi:hypothetical protein
VSYGVFGSFVIKFIFRAWFGWERDVMIWIAKTLRRWIPTFNQELEVKIEMIIQKLEEWANQPPRIG